MKKRLKELWRQDLLPRDHLLYLKNLEINPSVIYDIGSCVLHWTRWAERFFPNSKIILFEAMEEVEFLYQKYDYHLGVLSDNIREVSFYQNTFHPGGNSYYRENEEVNPDSKFFFPDETKVTKISNTLDNVIKEREFPLPELIKIDVQGAELDILKGADSIFLNCKDIIVELQHVQYNKGAPLKDETISYLEKKGFELVNRISINDDRPDADYHFRKRF